ncbi:MAG: pyruvate kinase [Candidatus Nanohaloarchaea archaeon]
MKRTAIVSTLGPATNTEDKIEDLVEAGVNVFRLNFSHGDHEGKKELFERIRNVSEDVAIMADTQGPEIRLNEVEDGTVIEPGDEIRLTTGDVVGDANRVAVDYDALVDHLSEGDRVMVDDGKLELKVKGIEGEDAVCEIVHGGDLKSNKSVNVPGKDVGMQAPTEKDKKDIAHAAKLDADLISLSFVKHPDDIKETREVLEENGASDTKIVAKIEHLKALDNYDEILEETDGIMVARGDLGVEADPSRLPLLQKEQIKKANKAGKPVITATQMLESMTENPSATRAEISDVANAVLDGSDAVMLSGETAVGDYPVETVQFMSEVVEKAEKRLAGQEHHTVDDKAENVTDAISKSVYQASEDLDVDYIFAHSVSGFTARNVSRFRPTTPILAFTPSDKVKRQLQLVWGVEPVREEFADEPQQMIEKSVGTVFEERDVDEDASFISTAGIPASSSGTTNMMQVRRFEEFL